MGVVHQWYTSLLGRGACAARRRLVWLWVVPIAIRLFYFLSYTPVYTPDWPRFLEQAESLLDGRGPTWQGKPDASFPPGYPALIALVFAVWPSHPLLRFVQFALSLASCYLVFFALEPRNRRFAVVALYVMCLSPWTGRLMCTFLTETLGIFLMSLLVFCLSRCEQGVPGRVLTFSVGLLCSALILTSPAVVFLALGVFGYVAWLSWRRWRELLALCAGGLLLMVPWQVHCYHATGRFQPAVFSDAARESPYSYSWASGFSHWAQSWMMYQEDLYFLWQPGRLDQAPDRAFRSAEERQRLVALAKQLEAGEIRWEEYDDSFHEVARGRVGEDWWDYHVLKPLVRGVSLWTSSSPVWRANRERLWTISLETFEHDRSSQGLGTAIKELALALLSLLVYVYYLAHLVLFFFLAVVALRSRKIVPLIILASVVIYTLVSAYTVFGEERRNYPFFPALLFLGFYCASAWPRPSLPHREEMTFRLTRTGAEEPRP